MRNKHHRLRIPRNRPSLLALHKPIGSTGHEKRRDVALPCGIDPNTELLKARGGGDFSGIVDLERKASVQGLRMRLWNVEMGGETIGGSGERRERAEKRLERSRRGWMGQDESE